MSADIHIEHGALDEITNTLRSASTDLDRARASPPPEAPDAGEAGTAVSALLRQLADETNRFVATAAAAGDAVADSAATYREADQRAEEGLRGAGEEDRDAD